MKKIDISTKKYPKTFTLVDDEDFEYLNQWKWRKNNAGRGYAIRTIYRNIGGEKHCTTLFIHRIVNNTPIGFQTDHINRNTLDNQKHNLRSATPTINQLNTFLRKDNKSNFKGIGWNKRAKKWRARITVNKKQINLGYFINIQEAILARHREEQEWIK